MTTKIQHGNGTTPERKELIFLSGKKGNGKFAIVDAEDYQNLSQWRWRLTCQGYAARNKNRDERKVDGKRGQFLMHRVINKTPVGYETDHINGDRLDNRKSNLRTCTKTDNCHNSYGRSGTSKYKGVSWDKERNKWQVTITKYGKSTSLGRYFSEEEAALVYNRAALELYGEFAKLNILQAGKNR